jgi:uncharacterized protein (TIGR02246 family)
MRSCFHLGFVVGLAAIGIVWLHARGQTDPPKPTDDEQAIRKAVENYAAALTKGDLDALLAFWAADSEFIDENGKTFKGKPAIATLLKRHIDMTRGAKVHLQITGLKILKGEVALEDGTAELTLPNGAAAKARYHAVWTKADGKWLLSQVRDLPGDPEASNSASSAALKELSWLVGDWTHDDKTHAVKLNCRWDLGKHFLRQDYTIKSAKDGHVLTVSQLIGYDPLSGQLKSWFFDSRGGYGEGSWQRDGNTWKSRQLGVLADGRTATSRASLKFLDDDAFLWHAADREIDGLPLADVEVKYTRAKSAKEAQP